MTHYKVKLLSVDLDGSALNDNREFSPEFPNYMEKCIRDGVRVVPCTGRPSWSLKELLPVKGIRYAIGSNGACVSDFETGEHIFKAMIPLDVAVHAIRKLEQLDVLFYAHIHGKHIRSVRNIDHFQASLPWIRRSGQETEDIASFLERENAEVHKLGMFAYDKKTFKLAMDELAGMDSLAAYVIDETAVEINDKNASKGNALKQLCEYLDIDSRNVVAVGDNFNDISMLEFAGYSVAMGNAIQELKERADYITLSNNEDGVGFMVKKLMDNGMAYTKQV